MKGILKFIGLLALVILAGASKSGLYNDGNMNNLVADAIPLTSNAIAVSNNSNQATAVAAQNSNAAAGSTSTNNANALAANGSNAGAVSNSDNSANAAAVNGSNAVANTNSQTGANAAATNGSTAVAGSDSSTHSNALAANGSNAGAAADSNTVSNSLATNGGNSASQANSNTNSNAVGTNGGSSLSSSNNNANAGSVSTGNSCTTANNGPVVGSGNSQTNSTNICGLDFPLQGEKFYYAQFNETHEILIRHKIRHSLKEARGSHSFLKNLNDADTEQGCPRVYDYCRNICGGQSLDYAQETRNKTEFLFRCNCAGSYTPWHFRSQRGFERCPENDLTRCRVFRNEKLKIEQSIGKLSQQEVEDILKRYKGNNNLGANACYNPQQRIIDTVGTQSEIRGRAFGSMAAGQQASESQIRNAQQVANSARDVGKYYQAAPAVQVPQINVQTGNGQTCSCSTPQVQSGNTKPTQNINNSLEAGRLATINAHQTGTQQKSIIDDMSDFFSARGDSCN